MRLWVERTCKKACTDMTAMWSDSSRSISSCLSSFLPLDEVTRLSVPGPVMSWESVWEVLEGEWLDENEREVKKERKKGREGGRGVGK